MALSTTLRYWGSVRMASLVGLSCAAALAVAIVALVLPSAFTTSSLTS